jgi:4-amino-4-deoxychorismate lyase
VSKRYLETIKAVNGVVQNLEYHQQRLESVLNSYTNPKLHNLRESLHPPQNGRYRCRVVYDVNVLKIEYIEYKKRTIKTLKIVYNDEIEYSKKYEDRKLINELFELRDTCDDILIVRGGLITDTSIANVAFYDGSHWLTPKRALLKGTTRERYLQKGKLIEKDLFVEDIKNFTAVALLNAMVDFDIIAQEKLEEVIC